MISAKFVTPQERAVRIAQTGVVIWLTGLPAAGKTTIAIELERMLFDGKRHVYRIDGDSLRLGLCAGLGYSAADRSENVRRAAALAAHLANAGLICIAALISPLRIDRENARHIVAPNRFVEVYVAASIETCRLRDPKGLYARAVRGEIAEFTGISAPYEPPLCPDVLVLTEQDAPGQCAAQILEYLQGR